MRALICSIFLMATACGELPAPNSAGFRVVNAYLESNFRVQYLSSGSLTTLLDDVQVASFDTHEPDARMIGDDGGDLRLYVAVMSHGKWKRWDPIKFTMERGRIYQATYSYNFVTSEFGLSHRWVGF